MIYLTFDYLNDSCWAWALNLLLGLFRHVSSGTISVRCFVDKLMFSKLDWEEGRELINLLSCYFRCLLTLC